MLLVVLVAVQRTCKMVCFRRNAHITIMNVFIYYSAVYSQPHSHRLLLSNKNTGLEKQFSHFNVQLITCSYCDDPFFHF
eukprot:m.32919 g.32919  ORF g.32919 m.32919 type:complete len:79 (+) comp6419_c1_seq1:319-555(+)